MAGRPSPRLDGDPAHTSQPPWLPPPSPQQRLAPGPTQSSLILKMAASLTTPGNSVGGDVGGLSPRSAGSLLALSPPLKDSLTTSAHLKAAPLGRSHLHQMPWVLRVSLWQGPLASLSQ